MKLWRLWCFGGGLVGGGGEGWVGWFLGRVVFMGEVINGVWRWVD